MAMKQRLVRLATGVIVALSTSVTHAALITFDYTATRIGGGIVTGTFGYDNSIGDTYPLFERCLLGSNSVLRSAH
jgi:hypothetical protein